MVVPYHCHCGGCSDRKDCAAARPIGIDRSSRKNEREKSEDGERLRSREREERERGERQNEIHAHTHTQKYMYMYIYIYVYVYVYIYICIYIDVYMYVYIYIWSLTQKSSYIDIAGTHLQGPNLGRHKMSFFFVLPWFCKKGSVYDNKDHLLPVFGFPQKHTNNVCFPWFCALYISSQVLA